MCCSWIIYIPPKQFSFNVCARNVKGKVGLCDQPHPRPSSQLFGLQYWRAWSEPWEEAIYILSIAHSHSLFIRLLSYRTYIHTYKQALVIAGIADVNRPAHKLSLRQSGALAATGMIWSRYSLVITPKNWNLFSVNIFVACTGIYQLARIWRLDSAWPLYTLTLAWMGYNIELFRARTLHEYCGVLTSEPNISTINFVMNSCLQTSSAVTLRCYNDVILYYDES